MHNVRFQPGPPSEQSESNPDLTSYASVTGTERSRDEVTEVKMIAIAETRRVHLWKTVLLVLFMVASASVSAATYILFNSVEEGYFSGRYEIFTSALADASRSQLNSMLLEIHTLSETITAESISSGTIFPFVTLPFYELHVGKLLSQYAFETITFTPFVSRDDKEKWEEYSVNEQGWITDSRTLALKHISGVPSNSTVYVEGDISPVLHGGQDSGNGTAPERYAPVWQVSPPPLNLVTINYDMLSLPLINQMSRVVDHVREPILSERVTFVNHEVRRATSTDMAPHFLLMQPVFSELEAELSKIVGLVHATISWDLYLANLLPDGLSTLYCVVRNTCGGVFTYELHGKSANYLGLGDWREERFDARKVHIPINDLTASGQCVYHFEVYPSSAFKEDFKSNRAAALTAVISMTFVVLAGAFFYYDKFVHRRNVKVIDTAARSNALVSSLFPSSVRDRLLASKHGNTTNGTRSKLESFLDGGIYEDDDFNRNNPIADLFPETTIMFADLAGFTAWSSTREPSQVFLLLETLYQALDEMAKKRHVFKVETIGDCYVAVAGLPKPQKKHAVIMARFARDCVQMTKYVTADLEVTLGPGTSELAMRVGLHSGAVTAGVLRGEKARFQLFGDTMNTASRMESTGEKERIHISQETADLLSAAGKEEWLKSRKDKIVAKGKGEMQTYWIEFGVGKESTVSDESSTHTTDSFSENSFQEKPQEDQESIAYPRLLPRTKRLVKWNVDVLVQLLKSMVTRRHTLKSLGRQSHGDTLWNGTMQLKEYQTVLDEVQEIILFPQGIDKTEDDLEDPDSIVLAPEVTEQLRDYVSALASMYLDIPFHNFGHASHVTMSFLKLMSRIVPPSHAEYNDHTLGIIADPSTKFACIFAALVHSVGHVGIPNERLMAERPELVEVYGDKSVGEQNSFDLAFTLLMDEKYSALRSTIYTSKSEKEHFRQLVVNCIMATDTDDKELRDIRNDRWNKAFNNNAVQEKSREAVNRKATIVIEHLIQASDVAHTMQHWHIYLNWNSSLFSEKYEAFLQGRAEEDPTETWYEDELQLFDSFVIPLAKKLKDCGVFRLIDSNDSLLDYAVRNRTQWATEGRVAVDEMLETAQSSN